MVQKESQHFQEQKSSKKCTKIGGEISRPNHQIVSLRRLIIKNDK